MDALVESTAATKGQQQLMQETEARQQGTQDPQPQLHPPSAPHLTSERHIITTAWFNHTSQPLISRSWTSQQPRPICKIETCLKKTVSLKRRKSIRSSEALRLGLQERCLCHALPRLDRTNHRDHPAQPQSVATRTIHSVP